MTDSLNSMPEWFSILPPLIAIVFALVFKEVITALLAGLLSGGLIIGWYDESWAGLFKGFLMPMDFVLQAVVPENGDKGHISVIVFSLLIGGTVALITANGSMRALVEKIAKKATSKRRGLFVTWLMGILIFFDDYANTMVVGHTMRPLTDRLKISREKLAYIVDSTAAPIAAVALVTTWIGAELLFIEDGIKSIGVVPFSKSSYLIFLESLKYSFYPFLTLIFILLIIVLKKDFGPMAKVEKNNLQKLFSNEEIPEETGRIWKGVLPVLIILFGTLTGLFFTGYSEEVWGNENVGFAHKLSETIGNSNSYSALLWSSFVSVFAAILFSLPQLGLEKCISHVIQGFNKMLPAILILVLAWALAEVTLRLGTAEFISSSLSGNVSPLWMPSICFVVAALVAFSTGSSWSTMALLYPVVIPSAWMLGLEADLGSPQNYQILLNVISTVLAGSVLGDHCSPISDTTILSSLASECNHISHVRTQMPYAITVGSVSLLMGTLPASMGFPLWLCFTISILSLYFIISYFGKMTE